MARQDRLEATLEAFFIAEGKRRRCWVFKSERLIRGFPDRMCLAWPGRIAFCELKRPGHKPTPLQAARIRVLKKLGMVVEVVDSREGVVEFYENWFARASYMDMGESIRGVKCPHCGGNP